MRNEQIFFRTCVHESQQTSWAISNTYYTQICETVIDVGLKAEGNLRNTPKMIDRPSRA